MVKKLLTVVSMHCFKLTSSPLHRLDPSPFEDQQFSRFDIITRHGEDSCCRTGFFTRSRGNGGSLGSFLTLEDILIFGGVGMCGFQRFVLCRFRELFRRRNCMGGGVMITVLV